jgi:hypothetical protein
MAGYRAWVARGLLVAAGLAALALPAAAFAAGGEAGQLSLPDLVVPLVNTAAVGVILKWFMGQNNRALEDVRRSVDRNTLATTTWILGGRSEEAREGARQIVREIEVENETRKRGRGDGR